jgi:hypothetical protein
MLAAVCGDCSPYSSFSSRLAARRLRFEQSARRDLFPAPPVRAILGISCLLLGIAMWACRVESSSELFADSAKPQAAAMAMKWVRTVDGWERTDSWFVEPVGRPRLHPLLVAAGQGLVSVMGLVVFKREKR